MSEYPNKVIIIFDGNCNFCSRWVLFIISRDGYDRFRFTASQMPAAKHILEKYNVTDDVINTFILVEDDHVYARTAGILRIFKNLPGLWPALYIFRIVPPFLRDPVYNFIARNRYKWFGKREECFVPDEKMKSKFL